RAQMSTNGPRRRGKGEESAIDSGGASPPDGDLDWDGSRTMAMRCSTRRPLPALAALEHFQDKWNPLFRPKMDRRSRLMAAETRPIAFAVVIGPQPHYSFRRGGTKCELTDPDRKATS